MDLDLWGISVRGRVSSLFIEEDWGALGTQLYDSGWDSGALKST